MGYKQSNFTKKAIARAGNSRNTPLITSPQLETKADRPSQKMADDDKKPKKEKSYKNPYDEFLDTWKQGDVLPLVPPGKVFRLCQFGNPLRAESNNYELDDKYKIKKSTVKFKNDNLTLSSKSLGPKLRDEVDSLLSRAMMGRFGLKPWVDDKNKLRCPPKTPNANQFTDSRMSNCFVAPKAAAGKAGRLARRAGAAVANATQVGGRTQMGVSAARDFNNLTQQDFIDMGYSEVSSRMAIGGRITGAMNLSTLGPSGLRYDPKRAVAGADPYHLGSREKIARGVRSTMLAKVTHNRIKNGFVRLPNGDPMGDITTRAGFLNAMQQAFPHVEPSEILFYFDNAMPAGLPFELKRQAKRGIQSFWEALIVEAIENPDMAKWVTKFDVDYNMKDAFQMTLAPFAPAIDTGGRTMSGAAAKLVSGRNAADGGTHFLMRINPSLLLTSSLDSRNSNARSSGAWHSIEGDMHYTATHEFGHLAHFSSVMNNLGFDVNNLTRYSTSPTAFASSATTGGGAAWRPKKENGGWIIDWSNMQNPMNSPSIQLVMDAARNLQTRNYGVRGGAGSADLKRDLENFYDAFGEAVHNNITDTEEERELMRQFAGGDYAAKDSIETRAEYYVSRRLFGETQDQTRIFPQVGASRRGHPFGAGPIRQSTRGANYVDQFAQAITNTAPPSGLRNRLATVGTTAPTAGKNPADVIKQLDDIDRRTFQIQPGTWNLTGAMAVGGDTGRVSLHAEQVRRAVRNNDVNKRRKRKPKQVPQQTSQQSFQPLTSARRSSTSNITGAMSLSGFDKYGNHLIPMEFLAEATMNKDLSAFFEGDHNRRDVSRHVSRQQQKFQKNNLEELAARRLHEAIADKWIERGEGWQNIEWNSMFQYEPPDFLRGFELGINQSRNLWGGDSSRRRPEGFNEKKIGSSDYNAWYQSYVGAAGAYLQSLLGGDNDPKTRGVEDAIRREVYAKRPDTSMWDRESMDALSRFVRDAGFTSTTLSPKQEQAIAEKVKKRQSSDIFPKDVYSITGAMAAPSGSSGDVFRKKETMDKDLSAFFEGENNRRDVSRHMPREQKKFQKGNLKELEARRSHEAIADKWIEEGVGWETLDWNTLYQYEGPDYWRGLELGLNSSREKWEGWDGKSFGRRPPDFNPKQTGGVVYSNWYRAYLQEMGSSLKALEGTEDNAFRRGMEEMLAKEVRNHIPNTDMWDRESSESLSRAIRDAGFTPSGQTLKQEREMLERNNKRSSRGGGITGAMGVSSSAASSPLAEKNLSARQERAARSEKRVANLQKALDVLERTGEWRGEEFGVAVSTEFSNTGDLDVFDFDSPTNLSKEDIEKEYGDVGTFINQVKNRIDVSEKEMAFQNYIASSKKMRIEQNTLDVEDLTPEQFEELLEESKSLTDEEFFDAVVHVGQSELEGGVLDPSKTSGGTTEGTGSEVGDTGRLNLNEINKLKQKKSEAEETKSFYQALIENFTNGKKTHKPKTGWEARELNAFFRIGTSVFETQFEKGKEFDLTRFEPAKDKVLKQANLNIKNSNDTIKEADELLAAMEDGGKFGYLSAYPASGAITTRGYFGRNAGSVVPKNVATFQTEFQASRFGGDGRNKFTEIEDPEMLRRWEANLRGTAYLVTDPKKITHKFAEGQGERQILGRNKPVFGVSAPIGGYSPSKDSKTMDQWGKVAHALMARAIRLERDGKEVNTENLLAARRGEPLRDVSRPSSSSITGAMGVSSSAAASSRTAEILSRANDKGIDIDFYEKEKMERVGRMNKNVQDGNFHLGPNPFEPTDGRDPEFVQGQKDWVDKMLRRTDSAREGSLQVPFDEHWVLENVVYESRERGVYKSFSTRLFIAKASAAIKGDSKKIEQIDKLIEDIKNMSAEELNLAVDDALKRLPRQFSQMASVQVSDPIGIAESKRYLTAHDVDGMKLANARGLSERDRFDIETVVRVRSNQELMFLGMSARDTSPEMTELRPASGFVTSQMSARRRNSKLKDKFGEDIEIQHPYSIGDRASKDTGDMARYGDATIILRPEVAERSLVFRGDSVADTGSHSTALKLSTIDESEYRGVFFDPLSILYADRTGDYDSIASPASNLPNAGNTATEQYQETMILGSFAQPDIAAIVMSPHQARIRGDNYGNQAGFTQLTNDANVTSLIATAKLRDEYAEKGIDIVLKSDIFKLDEVEPFNTGMTEVWVNEQIKGTWKEATFEELVPDEQTTPYEAYLRYVKLVNGTGGKDGRSANFDHPDNQNIAALKYESPEYESALKINQANLTKMIDEELKRLQSNKEKSPSSSSITGAMATDKIYYPREPSYGAFIGDAGKIFGDAKTWEEFKEAYNKKEIIFFDYETTGIDVDADGRTVGKGSPVQIGAVRMKGGKVIDRLNVFMKPDQPLGEWSIKNLKDKDGNPLTDNWLNGQVSMLKAHQMLEEFAGPNAIFGVQYAPFDKDVLDATLEKLGMQWRPSGYLDTKDIAEHTLPRWTPENPEGPSKLVKERKAKDGTIIPEHRTASNGLADITEYLGVDLGSKHHTADADSEAAGLVMSAIIDNAIEFKFSTDVLDMKSQNQRIAKGAEEYEKDVERFEQNLLGLTPTSRSNSITGAMTSSQRSVADKERSLSDAENRVAQLEKGLRILEETGEWRGEQLGVVVATADDPRLDSIVDANTKPVNRARGEIETWPGGLKGFVETVKEKIITAKRERDLQDHFLKAKRARIRQNVLDVEDISPQDLEILKKEGEALMQLQKNDREKFYTLVSPSKENREFVIHSGASELENDVLSSDKTQGFDGRLVSENTQAINQSTIRAFKLEQERNKAFVLQVPKTIEKMKANQPFTIDSLEELRILGSAYNLTDTSTQLGDVIDLSSKWGAYYDEKMKDSLEMIRLNTEAKEKTIKENSKILKVLEDNPRSGFLSASPSIAGNFATLGYFGRYSEETIPDDVADVVATRETSQTGKRTKINDQFMYNRWLRRLRGTAYLVDGEIGSDTTSQLGPYNERQILGNNKPAFGISSTRDDFQTMGEVGFAVLTRAMQLAKNGQEITPESVLRYRTNVSGETTTGITGAMTSSRRTVAIQKSKRQTKNINATINAFGGNFGGDTGSDYIRDLNRNLTITGPTNARSTLDAREWERSENYRRILDEIARRARDNPDPGFEISGPPYNPDPGFEISGPPDTSAPGFDLSGGPDTSAPTNPLHIGYIPDDNEFKAYLDDLSKKSNKRESLRELEAAVLDSHDNLSKQPRTMVPAQFIKSLLSDGFKQNQQRNKDAGIDKIVAAYEADIGIHPETPAEMRPALGFVLHMDEIEQEQKEKIKFLERTFKEDPDRYFPDLVELPYSKRTRGNNWNFEDAEIILHADVSDRTAYGNGHLFSEHIEPVKLNSTDNDLIMRANVDAFYKTDNRAENILEHLYNKYRNDHSAYKRKKYSNNSSLMSTPKEALIAGGFNANDIDEIRIPFDSIPKNFIEGHPDIPATITPGGKNLNKKESNDFLKTIKEGILSEEAIKRINPTLEEKKMIQDILSSPLSDFVIPENIQKKMNRFGAAELEIKQDADKYLTILAAESMREQVEKKGIKLSVTNKFGLNVFDPKTYDKNASKKTTAQEALRNKIEKQMEDIVRELREAKGPADATPATIPSKLKQGVTGAMQVSTPSNDSPISRTTSEKISEGPKSLAFGYEESGVVRVASTKEHEARFGKTKAEQIEYFKREYGLDIEVEDLTETNDSYKAAHYASLQAMDDVLSNFNTKELFDGQEDNIRFRVVRDFPEGSDVQDAIGFVREGLSVSTVELSMSIGETEKYADEIAEGLTMDTKLRGTLLSNLKNDIGNKFFGVNKMLDDFADSTKIPRTPGNELKIQARKEEIARRIAYGTMIHEMGHLLDALVQRDGRRAQGDKRWVSDFVSDFGQLPSVTEYGATNNNEKFAEAFSAWWLFSQNKTAEIVPQFQGGTSKEKYDFGEVEKIRDVASRIVKPIFDMFGTSMKSEQSNSNGFKKSLSLKKIPPLVQLYAILPTQNWKGKR